jgi:hypothetical protein
MGLGLLPNAGVPEIVSRPKPIHLRVFVSALCFARAFGGQAWSLLQLNDIRHTPHALF